MLKKIALIPVLLLLFACSDEPQVGQNSQLEQPAKVVTEQTSTPQTAMSAEHFLVFFLDPNGGPCRMQNSVLEGMADELQGRVNLHYVQTTVPADRQYFYAYGIRGLPSLVLADVNGKELKRLPPGVNPAEKIRELLQAIPN